MILSDCIDNEYEIAEHNQHVKLDFWTLRDAVSANRMCIL